MLLVDASTDKNNRSVFRPIDSFIEAMPNLL